MRAILIIAILFITGCKKDQYQPLSGDIRLSGYVYLADTINHSMPSILGKQKIYLNIGNDSSLYVHQTSSDSAGRYSIPSLQDDREYVLFTRYQKSGVEYEGVARINGGAVNNAIVKDLLLYPKYTNGIALQFTDALGGPLPNLPFRIYTSRVAAQYDSVLYATADTKSDLNARYSKINLAAIKYYVVASKVIGPQTLKLFDSVTATTSGLVRRNLKLE